MGPGAPITEERIDVDGVGVHVRRSAGEGLPVVFAHGNPTHSGDWVPFLERLRRPAIAFDLPGWGRSERPPIRKLDYSMHGLARFFGRALDVLGVDRHALVVHDWGGLALIDAQTHPERLDRLVVVNSVPLLPGYHWHWVARYFWRVPVVGEIVNATTTRASLALISRQSNSTPGPLPDELLSSAVEHWGPGRMRRPMLKLYRSGDPGELAAAGHELGRLDCPALVLWGMRDPYISERFPREYAKRLPNAELVELADAGHWPWLDRPDAVARIAEFLETE